MEKSRLILSHPTGNPNLRALAGALASEDMLLRFYTSIAVFRNSGLYSLTGIGPLKEFRKRLFSDNLKKYTHSYPMFELGRLASQKLGKRDWVRHETGSFCVDRVYRELDRYVSKRLDGANAVYAYEDGAFESFTEARRQAMPCIYDLPIGYWRAMRALLEEEKIKKPEWAETIFGFKDSDEKLKRKDKELQLADHIFVASSFTAKSLEYYPGKLNDVKVIPYGFPKAVTGRQYRSLNKRKLRVLFVGGLSQRKGIAYLFEAAEKLKHKIELTLIGQKPTESCRILNENLNRHNWIPKMPHSDVLKFMKTQDVLVFPSLFEGFGLVVTEAMSQGTPVITTNRTCGTDLIDSGQNGWLIEAGFGEALISRLEEILSNPGILKTTGLEALQTAKQRPWETYAKEMIEAIEEILVNKKLLV